MMDEDFHVPINVGCQNLTVTDETYSHTNSVSIFPSNLFDPSNQDQIMPRYPLHSMLQGDTMNDLHACLLSSNHAGFSESDIHILGNAQLCRNASQDTSISSPCPVSGTEVHRQIMAGTPISAASLAMLWAANCEARENSNNIAALAPTECPVEALKDSASKEYSDTLNCAFRPSLDSEYDGIPGDLGSKWYFNKGIAPLPLAGTGSERLRLQPFQFTENISSSDWISAKHMNSSSHSGVSRFSNELSLSLATCQPSIVCEPTITDQCSDISYSGLTSHSFCEGSLGSTHPSSNKNNPSGFVSYKPVQLPQLLSGSSFLHVMQEILAEIASYSLETFDQMSYTSGSTAAGPNIPFSSSHAAKRGYSAMHSDDLPDEDGRFEIQMDPALQVPGYEVNKKHLLSLLQVVDDRYNQCLDEIHTVVCAFHAVTELDPQIHASFALQTLSFLYKNLRERISHYIIAIGAQLRRGGAREQERSLETSFIRQQWALQQLRRKEHQLWRPQRGLPERSVSVLRAWMFQNFLHPYPKDAEKHLLAVKSGLTRSQVSNWFINARVRLWKPMIEEMYAEMNRRKNCQKGEEANTNYGNHVSIDNQRFKLS